MECKCYLGQMIWLNVVLQLALLSATIGDTAIQNVPEEGKPPDSPEVYAWSPWSSWSPCSRSCGRGVSVQKRYCLPRSKIAFLNTTLPPPVITVRVTRQVDNCAGVARRYHECNTQPCPDASRDTRAEQCSEYDRWPFRGRFYTWVPYIDGNAPCVLNCRPLGQHFYASLALVDDGTPCTKPGVRAICVQGTCKVVGLDSVLADASNVELRCGHRLVTGLFTRPRLPLGYTYVATVPRGACRLNVTELVASENFIALKVTNGSYITNGEFAISSPGTFEAAGARFHYTRTGGRDTIFSLGPIYAPVDIMVLYTQPTPNIRYEYFTESLPGEVKTFVKVNATDMSPPPHVKHTRRHHFSKVPEYTSITDLFLNSGRRHEKRIEENQIGLRRFTWKISSFSQCTRTCGGGIQIGKYRCIEGVDKEVSSVHCVGSPPSSRRRRCNNGPCPPRWRAAAWSVCPMCGPANRTRIVGCVQDHAKGIIKIKDRMCPDTKPVAFELCEIPDCESFETKRSFTSTASYEKNVTENFREGPIYTVSVNSSNANDIGPEYNYSPTIGWIYTEWSDCVGACGFSGVQSRGARCADPAGCGPRTADTVRACTVLQPCRATEGQWLVSEWSACSSDCGGWQARVVLCVGGAGAGEAGAAGGTGGSVLPAAACAGEQPPTRRGCGARCNGRHTWYYSEWTKCIGNCSSGIGWKQRSVVCATVGQEEAPAGARSLGAAQCAATAPDTRQPCALACADSGEEPVLKLWLATSTTESSESTFRVSLQRCDDQLPNCGLAVQARLCHYNYYTKNCCQSCKGRN